MCGPWSICCIATSGATGAKKRKRCSRGAPAIPTIRASSAPSMNRLRTGWRFTCSRFLPTGTENSSFVLWVNPAFAPLPRPCRFMLTEEAHHMFVGETGVSRIIQRTCEVMKENKVEDPSDLRALGVIDLPTIQKYLNFHYSVTLDLYGSDVSSNAANYFTSGLKGRFRETKLDDDHVLTDAEYPVSEVIGGKIIIKK